MNVCRTVFFLAATFALAGCPKDEDETTAVAPTPTPAPTPADTGPTEVKPEQPTATAIQPRVKTELDNRTDGITGTALAVPGAAASLQTPKEWTTTKSGDFQVSASPDKKAQIAAAPVGPEGATGKLPAAVTALGLTSCEWGTPEAVTVGKSKIAATAADGICKRGDAQVHAAYVAPAAEKLLVVGAWDPDGDSASVFGAMRSMSKPTGGGDASGIAACCSALRQNAKSAPPEQQGAYMMAAGACDAVRNSPQGRAALSQVRAALRGANVPSSCR